MTTTPPTAAQVDAFMNGPPAQYLTIYGYDPAAPPSQLVNMGGGEGDQVIWVIAYTDNAGQPHYEAFNIVQTGVTPSTDAQFEATFPPVANGAGPFTTEGQPGTLPFGEGWPYLKWLTDEYGAVTIRGYLLPAVPWPSPLDDAVQAWVNDPANWPGAPA